MKKIFLLLTVLCSLTVQAQNGMYVIKGNKVSAVYPAVDVDSVKPAAQTGGNATSRELYVMKDGKIFGKHLEKDMDSLAFYLPDGIDAQLYSITCVPSLYAETTSLEYAVPGQNVTAFVTANSEKYRADGLNVNGEPATYISEEGDTRRFEFTMPDCEADLEAVTVLDRHTITPIAEEHAYITMLNCCDNWDVPEEERIYDEVLDGPVKFYWGADNGYEASVSASTTQGDELEVLYSDDDTDFGNCYYVVMPDEPITIYVSATELTTYKGQPFTGSYKGYALKTGYNNLYTSESPEFSLSLSANTSYTATSTDEYAFNLAGCYTYNEDTGGISYVDPRTDQGFDDKGYALSGKWLGNGDLFVFLSDLDNDKPDNVRFYFASQSAFAYSCAATSSYGTRYLVELDRNGTKTWYYVDTQAYTATPVTLSLTLGESISEVSQAAASDENGEILFKYALTSSDGTPQFTFPGSERGTYSKEGGTSDDATLMLDGFGSATYGSQEGSYTVSNGLVAFTANGEVTNFSIDTSSHTYTVVASSEWDGPLKFMGMTSEARYDDATETSGTLTVLLDQNYAGKEAKGSAKVDVVIVDQYYSNQNTNGSTCSYAYDSANSTLLVSGLLAGTENGRSTERIELTFSVSADKQTLTGVSPQYIRSTSGGDTRYIPFNGLTLTARD